MSQPEQATVYDPAQALGHVLSLMSPDAGTSTKTWDLLEWLAQSHGLGDANAVMNISQPSNLASQGLYSMLNAVARLNVDAHTAPRRSRLIEDLLAAGANPWSTEVADGIAVIRASRGSSAIATATGHPGFPGWRALAPEYEFRALIQDLDLPALVSLLDAGLPVGISANRFASTPPWASLLDLCSSPEVSNELVRRGAPLGLTLVNRIGTGEMPAGPAILEFAIRGQGTPHGDAVAAAVLTAGLKTNHLGKIKVGVVLCGPKAIDLVAGTNDTAARANGLSAIASAASRNALTLDDKALAAVAEIIESLSMECTDMSKLRANSGMPLLGSRIEDLANRLAAGQATLGCKQTVTLAALVSGIVSAPWLVRWAPDMSPLERADHLLATRPENPITGTAKDVLSFWHRALLDQFGGMAPLSFFRGVSSVTRGGDTARWMCVISMAGNHVKAGGSITDPDFIGNIKEFVDHIRQPHLSFQDSVCNIIEKEVHLVCAHFDQSEMRSSTPSAAPTRPAPRM